MSTGVCAVRVWWRDDAWWEICMERRREQETKSDNVCERERMQSYIRDRLQQPHAWERLSHLDTEAYQEREHRRLSSPAKARSGSMSLIENIRCWIPFTLVPTDGIIVCERSWTEFPSQTTIQPSSRGIIPLTFIRAISCVFIQYYANAALCAPAIQSVACVSQKKLLIHSFFNLALSYRLCVTVCGCRRLQISAHSCLCASVRVCAFDVCLCEWASERACGGGNSFWLWCLASTWEKKKKLKNSPQVTDGNFSGPTMLQSISLHWDFLLLCLIAQLSLPRE